MDSLQSGTRSLAVAALCLGTIAVQFDSAVNIAFPDLVKSFALQIPEIQWIVISYTLTYAALMLVFGRIGDIFGHRRIFLAGAATSGAAFVLCTLAPTYPLLLAARVLQGIGAALTLSCGPALLTNLYSEDRRAQVLSLYTLLIGLGGGLGPIVGGFLVEHFGWPGVYAFRAPIAFAALVAGFILPGAKTAKAREDFDGLGAVLLVLSITAMLLALNQLQSHDQMLATMALLAASILLGVAFTWHEGRIAHPIIDMTYFRDADFSLLNVSHTLLGFAGFAIFLLAPFYLNSIANLSAPVAGLVLAAGPLGMVLSAPAAARLSRAVHSRRMALIGAGLSAVGLFTIGLLAAQLNLSLLVIACACQGFGMGLFQVAYFDIATATLPKENRGVAGSLVLMTRTLGIILSASLLSLAFRALSEMAGGSGNIALLAGFSGAFTIAASISMLVAMLGLLRGWAR